MLFRSLESENILKNGREKLLSKNLEAIVLQEVKGNISPFGNKNVNAFLLSKPGVLKSFRSIAKARFAGLVLREAEQAYRAENKRD